LALDSYPLAGILQQHSNGTNLFCLEHDY